MALDAKWLLAFELLRQNQPLLEDAGSALNTTGQEMKNLAPALTRILALGHGATPEELAAAEEAILPQAYEFRRILQARLAPALTAVATATAEVIPLLDAIIGDYTPPVPEPEGEPADPQADLFDQPLVTDGPFSVSVLAQPLDQ